MKTSKGTVVVTGGAGYIGSHTCKALAQKGYNPVTFDNLSTGHKELVKWGPFVEVDLTDREALKPLFQKFRPVAVMHFAASALVEESVRNPGAYYRNNVIGSLNLAETAIAAQVKAFVFSSTAAVYGSPKKVPILESDETDPINPYGETKLAVEQMLANFSRTQAFRFISLRYFNAAGADPDAETGEWHNPETHLIPVVLESAFTGRPFTVYGGDYDTPDGTCVRDYIHVTDLAQAHLLALEVLLNDRASEKWNRSFNLGNSRGHSVQEVIEAAKKVTGKNIPHKKGQRRSGDPAQLVADALAARLALGWSPQLESLEKIIETAWTWRKGLKSK